MRGQVPLKSYTDLLSRYLSPRAAAVAGMGIALLAATGLQLLTPAIAGDFIDTATVGASEARLTLLAALYFGSALLAAGAKLLATYLGEQLAWQATNHLRLDLLRHLLHLDQAFHARHLPGELIERVDGDISHLSTWLSAAGVDLFGSALMLSGLIVALSLLQSLLGIAFFCFVLLTAALLEVLRRRSVPPEERSREGSAAFFGLVGEVLSATEDLRALAAGPYGLQRLQARLAAWLPAYVRAQVGAYGVWVAALLMFGLGDGMAYAFGAHLYFARALPLGQVYTLVAYAQLVSQPLGTLRERLEELQGADAGILRIEELFRQSSLLEPGREDVPPGPLDLVFDDVTFTYPREGLGEGDAQGGIQRVSFRLAVGRRLGVVGRSGAGKSTIARLAMRLYDPQAGSVSLGGVDLRRLRLQDLRRQIGYVTQEVQIFTGSLRDNLTLFDETARDEDLVEYLRTIGLGAWLARQREGLGTQISPGSLSAGEAQLVSLVRVLHKDPPLVLLDEISSRLDPATEAALEVALGHLLRGRTAVVIAHRRRTLEQVDDILLLGDGGVVEFGPRATLWADPASHLRLFMQEGSVGVPS